MTKRPLLSLFLVSLGLALPVSSAMAEGLSAIFNGKSIHIDADQDWNEENYGLGLQYEFASTSTWKKQLMANGFRDSNDEMSYMIGAGLHRALFATDRLNGFYVDAGVNAFLMTRRDVNDNRPFPGVLPSLSIGTRNIGVNLTYLPRFAVRRVYDDADIDESMSGIIFLQVRVAMSSLLPAQ